MITQKTRLSIVTGMLLALSISQQALAADCDNAYVSQEKKTFIVLPTGVDDTLNLQCAFDQAVAAGSGATVRLVRGTYQTEQIVVEGFDGTFRGTSADRTTVQNLPELDVTVVDFFKQAPSEEVKWPTLIAFIGGDFRVSDMTIRAVGELPTSGWELGSLALTELAHGIVVLGPQAKVVVDRVVVEGEEAPNTVFGFNLINGIYPVGAFGGNPLPQSGTFVVTRSAFRNLAVGSPFGGLADHFTVVSGNTYDNVFSGQDIADVRNSTVLVTRNRITNAFLGIDVWDSGLFPISIEESAIVIRNNEMTGTNGILVEATFAGDVGCWILGNDVDHVDEIGILLDEPSYNCLVVGLGNGANIVDLGTDNVIIRP